MWRGFPRMIYSAPSSTSYTGIQYTPVLSIATCVHSRLINQSRMRSISSRNVPNVHVTTVGGLLRPSIQHATIFVLCTSRPAPTTTTTSMTPSFHEVSKNAYAAIRTQNLLCVLVRNTSERHQTVVPMPARDQPPPRGSLASVKVSTSSRLRHR